MTDTDSSRATRESQDNAERLSTAPVDPDAGVVPVGIGVLGWLRWAWRTLTSMRTALVLLFLLAVASVPGSLFPQRGSNPLRVNDYLANDPVKGRILDRLGMFDVFSSSWFAAIYVLLFISLAGCVLPRTLLHAKILRSRPPVAPRNLVRLPEHRTLDLDSEPQQVLDASVTWLRRHRWRVDSSPFDGRGGWVAAEKGYARETGNLLFHLSLLVLLVSVGVGSFAGFKATVIVREGSSFADTQAQFDSFAPGRGFDPTSLPPFSFTLTTFSADYQRGGQQNGAARSFSADVTVVREPGAAKETARIEVNEPLVIGGVKVFLVGHGYAPTITVRDAKGEIVFHDSVVFLPQDGNFKSTGVVKVPDTVPQLGLVGFFLPTAVADPVLGPTSTFPAADRPAIFISAWTGDLGLSSGRPQSVYSLDTSRMTRLGIEELAPGDAWALPGGHGTVTFDGYAQWASFTVAHDPGKELAVVSAVLAITGLALSLLIRRRRVWVRVARTDSGVTVVEAAGLTRSEHATVGEEVDALVVALGGSAPDGLARAAGRGTKPQT